MYQGKLILAHRLAYSLSHGSLDGSLLVLHNCDNPPCCNPLHLRAGTDKDNSADRKQRQRHWRDRHPNMQLGEKNNGAKLTEAIVRSVRADYASGMYGYREIAERNGINRGNVANVVTRKSWLHVV